MISTSAYGYNYEAELDAMQKLGTATTRTILMLDPDVTDETLETLNKLGVVGVRAFFNNEKSVQDAVSLSKRIAKLGWHLDIVLTDEHDKAIFIKKLPELSCELVLAHQAGITDVKDTFLEVVIKLLKEKKAWIKISGIFRPFDYAVRMTGTASDEELKSHLAVSRKLVGAASDRVIWASDWPFNWSTFSPEEGIQTLVNMIPLQIENETLMEQILVNNPAKLYKFNI